MWIHVYKAMYPHSEDTLITYVLAKMWIHVYIVRYPHLEDIQHIPLFVFDAEAIWMHSLTERKMWIHQTTKFDLCPDNVDSSLYRDGNVDTFTYLMP